MSDVRTTRPEYDERSPQWRLMRDCIDGEDKIKDGGADYLPMPSGFAKQPDGGTALYEAYKKRAQFPEITAPAITAMVGVIHSTEIQIDLPARMGYLWESATGDGQSLEAFHRHITSELLSVARYGILAGAPAAGGDPYLTGYTAEAIINWSDEGDFFVLDESSIERDGFAWADRPRYRVLEIKGGAYTATVHEGDSLAEVREVTPTAFGGGKLDHVPFVVANPIRVSTELYTPPVIGVSRAAVAIYQLSADYRWQLFMTGQETLFVFNAEAPDAVGAGVVASLTGDGESQPDAKYVGPAGTGIAAHRVAIQDEIQNAATAGAKLFATGSTMPESGDALRIRFAAETAGLATVAMASCQLLEVALRNVGALLALPESEIEQIVVHPPKSFAGGDLTPQEVMALVGLTDKGMLSLESAYEKLQAGGWASAERDWEMESNLIDVQGAGDNAPPVAPSFGREAAV